MKPGDKVLIRKSQQQVEVHEVDGAHVTVRWLNPATNNTESCTYPEYELEPYTPPPMAETKPAETETKPPADETPKAKKSKK